MGALEVRNKKLRCINCLDLRRLLIIPGYPEPKIEISCHCNKSIESLLTYWSETQKITNIKIECTKCYKKEIKHPRFCYECLAVYCSKCFNNHKARKTGDEPFLRKASISGHRTIPIEKLDFYCYKHQDENFTAYCHQCRTNICAICVKDGVHKEHKVELYDEIKIDKGWKDQFKQSIKKVGKKIEYNNKTIKNFCKKHEKMAEVKDIEEQYKVIEEENNDILELMKNCFNLYDRSKFKNYSIIYNVVKNAKFNLKYLELVESRSPEQKAADILQYLKKDVLILFKRNKTNPEEFDVDNEEGSNYIKTETSNLDDEDNENVNHQYSSFDYTHMKNKTTKNKSGFKEKEEVMKIEQPVKKQKMSMALGKAEEKEAYQSNNPQPKKLKMPSMFEKKEEDKKPKERAAIIKTGAGNLGQKKDFLAKMMMKGPMGGPMGMGMGMGGKKPMPGGYGTNPAPREEKVNIVHETNDTGSTEQILNRLTVSNSKRKKPKRSQRFGVEGKASTFAKPKKPSIRSEGLPKQLENNIIANLKQEEKKVGENNDNNNENNEEKEIIIIAGDNDNKEEDDNQEGENKEKKEEENKENKEEDAKKEEENKDKKEENVNKEEEKKEDKVEENKKEGEKEENKGEASAKEEEKKDNKENADKKEGENSDKKEETNDNKEGENKDKKEEINKNEGENKDNKEETINKEGENKETKEEVTKKEDEKKEEGEKKEEKKEENKGEVSNKEEESKEKKEETNNKEVESKENKEENVKKEEEKKEDKPQEEKEKKEEKQEPEQQKPEESQKPEEPQKTEETKKPEEAKKTEEAQKKEEPQKDEEKKVTVYYH